MTDKDYTSREVAAAALKLVLSEDRVREADIRNTLKDQGISTSVSEFGGEFISNVSKIIERAVVSAKRENVIGDKHNEEGAVAGAAREALACIMNKAIGLNVGGKIGIARKDDHVCVALFFGIGLLNLNEIAVGLGHRAV